MRLQGLVGWSERFSKTKIGFREVLVFLASCGNRKRHRFGRLHGGNLGSSAVIPLGISRARAPTKLLPSYEAFLPFALKDEKDATHFDCCHVFTR